jgi:hypothetical protein
MKLIISLIFAAGLAPAATYDLTLSVVDETITPTPDGQSWIASNAATGTWTGTVISNPFDGKYRDPIFTYESMNSPCGGYGDNTFSFGTPEVWNPFTGSTTEVIHFTACMEIMVTTALGTTFDIRTLTHGTPDQPEQLGIIYYGAVPVPDSTVPETETMAMLGIGLTLIGLLAAKRARILTAPPERAYI